MMRYYQFFSIGKISLVLSLLWLTGCSQIKPDNQTSTAPLSEQIFSDDSLDENLPPVKIAQNEDTDATKFNDNVWSQIRQNFQLSSNIEHPSLLQKIKWMGKHPEYFDRISRRAKPYIAYILAEANKRKLPSELVLLPIVESAYNPFAYSRGRATGLWQFIPSTGRAYHLKQNWWSDERRDIVASTQAAFDYLERLHQLFDGDWLLALAAYNSGQGTVLKAMRKNRKLNLPTDFWHLELPAETKAYVPKLLAIKTVVANPKQYNASLLPISLKPTFKQVTLKAQIDLSLVAQMANIKLETLRRLNPAFNRWATDPDAPHSLLLPINFADDFVKSYAQLPLNKHLRWSRYKIRSGDSLIAIAKKYKSSVKHLKRVNKIRGNNIRAGKYLLIPLTHHLNQTTLASLTTTTKKKTPAQFKKTRIKHTVKKGENFWLIAKKYQVHMKQIASWNDISLKKSLKPGRKLSIWLNKKNEVTAYNSASNVANDTLGAELKIQAIHYTVKRGDSLSVIANKYKVKVKDLYRWNTMSGKYIKPGQRIKVLIDITQQNPTQG